MGANDGNRMKMKRAPAKKVYEDVLVKLIEEVNAKSVRAKL